MKTIFKIWYIRITRWEFWPTRLVYFPVFLYYLWLAIKSRSFFFFTVANPNIEMGGLYGASKYRQLQLLPDHLKPKTHLFEKGTSMEKVLRELSGAGIRLPIIAKPDRAERGIGVRLVTTQAGFIDYINTATADYVVQEYVDFPFEAGVFFFKMPDKEAGQIPSLVIKEFLTVTGDGKSTVKELVFRNDRGLLVWGKLKDRLGEKAHMVLKPDEKITLEPIGNHNRGTKFLNGNNLINSDLENFFTRICENLSCFHYGRLDLKASGLGDFLQGTNIRILEVNGVNAEPAHIYDPSTKLLDGIKTLLVHWNLIYKISILNRAMGHRPATLKEAVLHYKQWKLSSKKL